jgi:hypothetical protein
MMIPLLWCRGYQWSEASCWGAGKSAPSLGIGAPCEYHPLQPCCWFWISTPTQASSKQREIDRPKGDSYPFTGCSAGIGSIYVYILLLASYVEWCKIYIYIYVVHILLLMMWGGYIDCFADIGVCGDFGCQEGDSKCSTNSRIRCQCCLWAVEEWVPKSSY